MYIGKLFYLRQFKIKQNRDKIQNSLVLSFEIFTWYWAILWRRKRWIDIIHSGTKKVLHHFLKYKLYLLLFVFFTTANYEVIFVKILQCILPIAINSSISKTGPQLKKFR